MSLEKLKRLDEETQKKLTDGRGPADECLCGTLAPLYPQPEENRGHLDNMRQSIKNAIRNVSGSLRRNGNGPNAMVIPISGAKGQKAGLQSSKEVVKRAKSCGKCACGKKDFVMKHTYATIQIVTPDLSSICDCPNECLPEKARQLTDNIKVTIERVETPSTHPGIEKKRESETSISMKERDDCLKEEPTELPETHFLKEQVVGSNQVDENTDLKVQEN